jgi:spermidine synthase
MSDTQDEINDLFDIFAHATGHVLVNGLGLGVVVEGLCRLPHVTHITIIENSKDVLTLVADHYRGKFGDRITIIHADALTWKPPRGTRYGAVWHDIWPSICSDHLPEMCKLHRKYGRRTEWQGSWCRAEMERQP